MDRTGWIRVTAGAAVVGALAWLVKWVTIALQSGAESAIDQVAFAIGLALVMIGATSVALRLTRGRGAVATGLACLGAAVVAFLLVPGLSIVSSGLFGDDTYVGSEGGLTALALISLVVGVTGLRERRLIGASASVWYSHETGG